MTVRRSRRAVGGFLRDFQEFALKGNVVDLAVGVVIGAAFGKIVESLVNDVILKLVPVAGGNWSQWTLGPITIGNLLSAILNFLIVALVLFLVIRLFAQFLRDEAAEAPPDPVVESNERLREAVDRLTQTLQSRNF